VLRALQLSLAAAQRSAEEVQALFAPESKRDEVGLREAAAQLCKPLRLVAQDELLRHASATLTRSEHALRHYGVGSVAEAAALAGACTLEVTAHLLGPRSVAGQATCALALAMH
jgi:cobalt-precorrin 5A hydrolase